VVHRINIHDNSNHRIYGFFWLDTDKDVDVFGSGINGVLKICGVANFLDHCDCNNYFYA